MRPELTIAIPTYNRVEKLKKSLPLILEQAYDKDIEIFVSDNASNDGTQNYLKELQKKYPKLGYYRNDKNLGLDGNFLNCFNKANGHYLWMLSDDDFLLPNAVQNVFLSIKDNPVIIHCNNSWIGSSDTKRFLENGIIKLNDKNDFLLRLGIAITSVSTLIYNMDLVNKLDNISKFTGEELLLSHVAMSIMKNNGVYVIITDNCIKNSVSSISYDFYKTFFYGMHKLLFDTGLKSGFRNDILDEYFYNLCKFDLLDIILIMHDDNNWNLWDKEYIWPVIQKYSDLYPLYDNIINTKKTEWLEARLKIQRLRFEEIITKVANFDKIYLYGTGNNANIFFEYAKEERLSFAGAIITDGQCKNTFNDLKVFYLSEVDLSADDIAVISTTSRYIEKNYIYLLKNRIGNKKNIFSLNIIADLIRPW